MSENECLTPVQQVNDYDKIDVLILMKQYYYLIASLPDLRLDDYKEPYRVRDFVAEIKEDLTASDRSVVEDILCMLDIPTIADALSGSEKPRFIATGNWSYDDILVQLEDPEPVFPRCLNAAITTIRLRQKDEPLLLDSIEYMLWDHFYAFMKCADNAFIRQYFTFDRDLRNIISGITKKTYNLDTVTFIGPEDDEIITRLSSSQAQDFNLSSQIDYMQGLLEHMMQGDIVHRERFIDEVRWGHIDTITTFNYFDIDVLLGFLIKLILVERWVHLEPKRGEEVFKERITIAE